MREQLKESACLSNRTFKLFAGGKNMRKTMQREIKHEHKKDVYLCKQNVLSRLCI